MKSWLVAVVAAMFATQASAQQIALTFDDLPSHDKLPPGETRVEVAEKIIAALKGAQVPPVYGFVNGLRLVDDPASAPVLSLWREAGFPLGNHTYSHMNLDTNSVADWEADALKNESVIAPLMKGSDSRWLRFPFLAEGDTIQKHLAIRAFLAKHRYRIASVTMSFDDYLWNSPYARCVAKGEDGTIAQMEAAYLAAAEGSLNYYHNLSIQLFGRDIAYVLLMHLGAFDARMLPRLLDLYRSHGVRFVTLEQAERDPFYARAVDPAKPEGPMTLEQAMQARGVSYFPGRLVRVMAFDDLCK
jgi:peptidoglycan/xylan/chitin deacetylase (PgdA/CDA1 family)